MLNASPLLKNTTSSTSHNSLIRCGARRARACRRACSSSRSHRHSQARSASSASSASSSNDSYAKTLSIWLLENERDDVIDTDLAILLSSIASACKQISSLVKLAPLQGNTGAAGTENASGDEVKKLDVLANEVFVNTLRSTGRTGIIVTEEEEQPVAIDVVSGGDYIATFDPIDGSSNLDAAVTSGAIFGVYHPNEQCKVDASMDDVLEQCLTAVQQSGEALAASGYCMFSASAVFMITVGNGVYGFTLDETCGEFILTHEKLKIPEMGQGGQAIVSCNLGNTPLWDPKLAKYVDTLYSAEGAAAAGLDLKHNKDKPYSYRYIGALVGDFHRTLLYGGIWLYPPDSKAPEGKARLLYEVAPIGMIAEQAGGMATFGDKAEKRVLDVVPKKVHQKHPMFVGSKGEVERLQKFLA